MLIGDDCNECLLFCSSNQVDRFFVLLFISESREIYDLVLFLKYSRWLKRKRALSRSTKLLGKFQTKRQIMEPGTADDERQVGEMKKTSCSSLMRDGAGLSRDYCKLGGFLFVPISHAEIDTLTREVVLVKTPRTINAPELTLSSDIPAHSGTI